MVGRLWRSLMKIFSIQFAVDIRVGQPIDDEWTGRERPLRSQWVTVYATQVRGDTRKTSERY